MKYISIILFLLVSISSFAQYTITAGMNPVEGDVERYYKLQEPIPLNLNEGENQLWNLSKLAITTSVTSGTFVNLSDCPNPNAYPQATIGKKIEDNGNVGYRYFAVNNDSIYDYWNDVRWFKFPYQFGTSSVHAYTVVSSEVTQFYSRVAADGTGTLVIPGYTLTNILKVNHYLQIKRSSSNHGWTTTTKTDLFYCALSKFPILTISYDYDYNWIHQSNSKVSGYVNAELPVKWKFVGDPRLEPFALFPNPITDNKVLLSVNQPYDEVDLLMYDGFGKLVLSQRIRGVSDNEIDLTGIGQGVYIVQIKSPASSEFKKIVVQ